MLILRPMDRMQFAKLKLIVFAVGAIACAATRAQVPPAQPAASVASAPAPAPTVAYAPATGQPPVHTQVQTPVPAPMPAPAHVMAPPMPTYPTPPAAPRPPAPPAPPMPAAAGLPPEAPKLVINGGMYSPSPDLRMAIVNGNVVREGANLGPGVVLEQIRPTGVVLAYRGARYTVVY